MFEKILDIFKSKPKKESVTSESLFKETFDNALKNKESEIEHPCKCKLCQITPNDNCNLNTEETAYLKEHLEIPELDPNKKTILLIDDNSGVLSFLMDDLKSLESSIS